MSATRFSISTYLFHQTRLDREHLVEIAAHGFDAIELFALRSHFDYTDPAAVEQLGEWLDDTRLSLAAVHAPTAEAFDGRWRGSLSLAATGTAARLAAVDHTWAAIDIAKTLRYDTLVVHLGLPEHAAAPGDNDAVAARASLDVLMPYAGECGVQIALEVQTNRLSTPDALVALIEEAADWPVAGICVDTGHARLLGDPVDAIESASGHIIATHVNDNRGLRDDHLVPYDGAIDWPRALLAFLKVGYAGPWTFEVAPAMPPVATLARAAAARQRFEQALGINDEPMSQ
ncbi:MAG: sugar phosphate isomerase/epimerase [Acidobacteria bacterium]|nr:sugar phosphate isomerase/epimerase [Acidobacteriota bacterium]